MRKMSETLQERIADTEAEIAALTVRQGALAAEKQPLLAASTVDVKLLATIEAEAASLPFKIESLRSRVALIVEQLEVAEATEAGQRIGAIEAEYQLLAQSLTPLQQEWREGLERLATLFAESQAGQAQLQLLNDEGAYLHERYDTRWPQCPPVACPSRADVTTALEASFQKSGWRVHGTHWREKADAVRQKRNVAEAAAMATQRRSVSTQRMVKMSTPAFVAGPKA